LVRNDVREDHNHHCGHQRDTVPKTNLHKGCNVCQFSFFHHVQMSGTVCDKHAMKRLMQLNDILKFQEFAMPQVRRPMDLGLIHPGFVHGTHASVCFDASLGNAKPVTVKALPDSGVSDTTVNKKFAEKLQVKNTQGSSTVSNAPAGEMKIYQKVEAQFVMPELHHDSSTEWNMHVTKSSGPCDVIIGRDILKFLTIDLRFSDEIIERDRAEMPFEDGDASTKEAIHAANSDLKEDAAHGVKRILDAKCDKADVEKICQEQAEPDEQQQEQLAVLLHKCEALFDRQSERWHGQEVKLELQEGAKPHHARACNVPRSHMQTLKAEAEHLVEIGVLKKA